MSLSRVVPAEDYPTLRKQFMSLKCLAISMRETIKHYSEKDYSLAESRLKSLEESLASERDMNSTLTEELDSKDKRISRLEDALHKLEIGGCKCLTKTGVYTYHKNTCPIYIIGEALYGN